MRRVFTTEEALAEGRTERQLQHGVKLGLWIRITRGAYAEGSEPLDEFTEALGRMRVNGGVAWGEVAGVLHCFDSVKVTRRRPPRRRRATDDVALIQDYRCTDALRTIVDLAETLDDATWEQAMESGLRTRHFAVEDLVAVSSGRVRRVLALRSKGAPPTESLLETLMVQLARAIGLPDPLRQVNVYDEHGSFIARVDLAWPEIGLFIELDGQQHKDQPVHDARRETAVVAATGWLCGRFTWREVHDLPVSTGRRLRKLFEAAAARPLVAHDQTSSP